MLKKRMTHLATASVLVLATGVLGFTDAADADGSPIGQSSHSSRHMTARHVTAAESAYRSLLDHSAGARVLTAAHRGQWRAAPENSLPAIRAAFDHGAEVVELDIRRTKDGQLVLMHDESVDRTTNGTGKVSDLTLDQIKKLRLRQGVGGAQAPPTDEVVLTLAEAMKAAKDRGLVNLDKGWPNREAIYQVLRDTGTVRNGIFKSDAPVADVLAFRAEHPDALYFHIVQDSTIDSIDQFGGNQPIGYEVIFDNDQDAVVRKPVIDRMRSTGRIWINSMWFGLADHYTDEASLIDPARGWGALTDIFGATVIQTDNVESLEYWLRTGRPEPRPSTGTIRIESEGFARGGEGVAYHDSDKGNHGTAARLNEDVDICDQDGAVAACWIRAGEWIDYEFVVGKSGYYDVAARVSSPYSPAGTYRVAFDGGARSAPVPVNITTGHSLFFSQPSGITPYLKAGSHRVRLLIDENAFQNFNLDYLQLTRTNGPAPHSAA
ncbi:glycerophosphodiester phosphodiesterase family protein [Streptomyces sp. NPDC051217]|uniref:glycerophosphodiester phosphodiesterase family protein n=1 Tax=Streptomyces sp. NPDC051217 TaxID=3365644 RepID=UPI0037919F0B